MSHDNKRRKNNEDHFCLKCNDIHSELLLADVGCCLCQNNICIRHNKGKLTQFCPKCRISNLCDDCISTQKCCNINFVKIC